MKLMKILVILLAVSFPIQAVLAENGPDFPFSDWSKIQDGSTVFSGDEGECGPGHTHSAAGYYIDRADGIWRLFGAVDQSESNRWVGYSLDSNAMPH